jgi:dTDP-4-amino-4,6-dideoxygalactose transaminase
MNKVNQSPWPSFSIEEAKAIERVLLSNRVNYWTGTECRDFEQEFSKWVDTKYAVSLSNGTLALDVALKALNVSAGDEIVVTPRTFIASVSCVVNAGATPVFADVESDSGNISANTISRVLTPRTKGVICVHLGGWPCDMDPIMALAEEKGLFVIEDCAQAHGAMYKGRSVGSIGHVGAWSFCQDKIMTTGGEGGMVTTNSEDLWRAMWSYKDHGKSYDAIYNRTHQPGFRWVHESFGTNWRMLELQAAIGRVQLKHMEQWHQQRVANSTRIWECASQLDGLNVPRLPRFIEHAAYKCYIYVAPEKLRLGWSRDRILVEIQKRGVPCAQGSCSEVYLERAFEGTAFRPSVRLPNAKALGDSSIAFMVHPTLTTQEVSLACTVLAEVMALASQ